MITSSYIHIPFCLAKCRYCGFNSAPAPDPGTAERYCQALRREIQISQPACQRLRTIYFGGGTPTILSTSQLTGLMDLFRERLEPDCEATIEANPETVDAAKLCRLRESGIDRLSLGVQSFDDDLLRMLGRVHDSERARAAFAQARTAGFGNIGLDLIFGLPGQTQGQWLQDLEAAVDMGPDHISTYSLTYEPGTEFTSMRKSGSLKPCDEGLEADMYLAGIEKMSAAGYEHYEVSNFARPGFRSRHNLNYWICGDYLGFGAGAHSHVGGRRWENAKGFKDYTERVEKGESIVKFEEELTRDQQLFEAIFLGLRMVAGIDAVDFHRRWGASPDEYRPEAWKKYKEAQFLTNDNGRFALTGKGLLLADSILSDFAP